MKKLFLTMVALLSMTATIVADEVMNPVITSMPSLTIAPDARAAGMGDLGVATDADLAAQYWNPAKYAFMNSNGGITASYTPWLRKLGVTDIDLAYLAGYYNFGEMAGGIGVGFTYFSMGDVQLTDLQGNMFAQAKPNEWALDLSYYRKLHEYVSMSVALRFMYSDLNNGVNASTTGSSQEMVPAWTMGADVALYYRQPISLPMGDSYLGLGLNIKNLGGKMSYDEVTKNFIPASLNLGASYELPFDKYNTLTFNLEANKLMVPTRKSNKTEGFDANDSQTWQMTQDEYSELNSAKGWFQSFGDAPGGIKEEFREVRWAAGLEYSYNKQFFARAGYSYENKWKGNRNYMTVGAGFHLSIVTVDVSYCIGLAASNPLDQTMRFTLGFDLYGIKDLVNNRR